MTGRLAVVPAVLHEVAAELRRCAERVAEVAPRLLAGAAGPGTGLSPLAGVPGAETVLGDLVTCCGPVGVPAAAAELAALAVHVQLAATAYTLADGLAGSWAWAGGRSAGDVLAEALPALSLVAAAVPLAADPFGVLRAGQVVPVRALALLVAWEAQQRLVPAALRPPVDPLLGLLDRAVEGRVTVREVDPAAAGAHGVSAASLASAAASPAGALSAVRLLSAPAAPSTFAVVRTSAGPPPRYVVCLPGLQHWAGADRSAADLPGAVATLTGHSSYVDGARAALLRLPTPSRVLLVGHSQGGMVAQALAGDGELRAAGVRVSALLTAGSPRLAVAIPRGVAHLALESEGDLVPPLGDLVGPGLVPAPRRGADDDPVVRFPATHPGLSLGNHALDGGGYIAAAGAADPATARFRARTAAFFTDTVTSLHVYQVRDGGLPP